MEKLSNMDGAKNTFMYFEKKMPVEFSEVCKANKFYKYIIGRNENPPRYFDMVSKFLKYNYNGDLPKRVYDVAVKLKLPDYKRDLFYMNEDGYKNVRAEEYADFFKNQPSDEQERLFAASDYGARTLFQLMQDVESGNVVERMIAYHTKGILSQNENASAGSGKISTYCDFIYKNPPRSDKEQIEVPIELKTKFTSKIDNIETIKIRGSIKKIMETKGMILVVYVKLNKAVLIDPIGKEYTMKPGKMKGGKDCVDIFVSSDEFVDFTFWEYEDVKRMMNMIWDQYHKRETK